MEKRAKLKALTEHIEKEIQTAEDKSIIDKSFLEKIVRKFHKPPKAEKESEVSFFDIMEKYVTTHKLSESRRKNFKVIMRSLHRFELYWKKEGHRGFKITFANLNPELLRQIENFLLNEQEAFLKYPEIYDLFPYSAKVALLTPKRKRPPILDKDGNEVELKQDLDDGSGIQPIDEQAFTTVNDFEGQEGFGVENAEGEQEAGQSDGFDDLFADGESESDDDYGFGFGDDSSDDE